MRQPGPRVPWDAPLKKPAFNHFRGDSSQTPCPTCAILMAVRGMQAAITEIIDEGADPFDLMFVAALMAQLENYFNSKSATLADVLETPP